MDFKRDSPELDPWYVSITARNANTGVKIL
jgi:hypothetical protein